MTTPFRLPDAIRTRFSSYAKIDREEPATLGDASGNVVVSNPNNDPWLYRMVYVTVRGSVTLAYNDQVPNTPGLPIYIAPHPTIPQLIIVKRIREIQGLPYSAGVARHAASHIYLDPNGGDDVVWVDVRQYLPLRVSIVNGLTVHVYRAIVFLNGRWRYVGDKIIDLSAYLPGGSTARYVLISVNQQGQVTVTSGTPVASIEDLTLADIPSLPDTADIPCAAVALYGGQAALREGRSQTDIVDLRFSAGGGAGDVTRADMEEYIWFMAS